MRFRDKVVMVTGAASGFGRAMAVQFAEEGARVVLADVLEDEGRDVAAQVVASGGAARFVRLDVSSEAEWKNATETALADFGTIDVLVNNAGISGTAFPDVLEIEAWHRLMSINSTGAFLGTHFVVPIMQRAKRGVIINMSSISAVIGQKNVHFAYNASKASLRLLTKATAVQFGRDGIRCNSVHPGLMQPMRTSGNVKDPAVRAKYIERIPMGRSGETEEVVKPVLFLASDDASYISGVELYVDGGYLAS
jgi:NAD(P)-dependent dehydrogenase (short-subunit alcohol dehydrogenase family)